MQDMATPFSVLGGRDEFWSGINREGIKDGPLGMLRYKRDQFRVQLRKDRLQEDLMMKRTRVLKHSNMQMSFDSPEGMMVEPSKVLVHQTHLE